MIGVDGPQHILPDGMFWTAKSHAHPSVFATLAGFRALQ